MRKSHEDKDMAFANIGRGIFRTHGNLSRKLSLPQQQYTQKPLFTPAMVGILVLYLRKSCIVTAQQSWLFKWMFTA